MHHNPSATSPSPFNVGTLLRYDCFEQVGEGAFGHVYKARDREKSGAGEDNVVALKRLVIPEAKEQAGFPTFALREITYLKRLKHPNIVNLLNIVSSRGCEDIEANIRTETLKPATSQLSNRSEFDLKKCGTTFLVFEYVEHDLSGLVDSQYPFDSNQCRFLALQMMRALDYLHQRRIMHRDIKSSNVLISNNLLLKLADFGMARQVQQGIDLALRHGAEILPAASVHCVCANKEEFTNNVVTMWYRPPELLLGEKYYLWNAVDVWSAGCVLAELELLRPLFPGKTTADQMSMIMDVVGVPTEDHWPGVSELPNYPQLVKPRAEQSASSSVNFRATYERKISEDLLSFIDRLLVLAPDKRLSPSVALNSSEYLRSFSEYDVRPLGLGRSSFHEFETKRSLRHKRDAEKNRTAINPIKDNDNISLNGTSLPQHCSSSRGSPQISLKRSSQFISSTSPPR